MLNSLSKKIVYTLALQEKDTVDVCVYGCEILLYTIISTIGLMLIAICLKSLKQGIIIIAVFYINQSFGGGIHAKTHTQCFLFMAVGLGLAISFSSLPIVYYVLGCASLLILFIHPLILHPNKEFLKKNLKTFRRRSQFIVGFEIVLFFISVIFPQYVIASFAKGLFLSAVSRLSAYICKNKILVDSL